MNPADGFRTLFLVLAPLGVLALGALVFGLGRWLERRLHLRKPWLSVGVPTGALLVLLVGGSLYLDGAGLVAPGKVVAKDEQIVTSSDGGWTHAFTLDVQYQPRAGSARTVPIDVDEATYDRLHEGADVQVRYVPALPDLARLAEQSSLSVVLGLLELLVPRHEVRVLAPIVAGLALVGLVLLLRARGPWRWALLPLLLACGVWLVSLARIVAPALRQLPPSEPELQATAEVRRVRTVVISPLAGVAERARLATPYDLVVFAFVPGGRQEPVVAVDAVDAGSVSGASSGGTVIASYPAAAPREARLVGATRHFVWQNALGMLQLPALILVVASAWFVLVRRNRAARRRRASDSN